MEIDVIHIDNYQIVTLTGHDRGSKSDRPQRQGNKTSLMLWSAGVHTNDPRTQLFCLDTLLKTKKTPVGCTTLAPHSIATSLYTAPNLYKKLG